MPDETRAALQKELSEVLKTRPELRSCRIEVAVTDEIVTLTGTVNSFYSKQIAQESLRSRVAGFKLQNLLEVTQQATG